MAIIYPEHGFNFKIRIFFVYLIAFMLFVFLPLAGVIYSGKKIDEYLEFPPVTRYVSHAPDNNLIFCIGLIALIIFLMPFLRSLSGAKSFFIFKKNYPFPVWGYFSIGLMIVSWALAWGVLKPLNWLRPYYFTPLWLGFIGTINGLTVCIKGKCLLSRAPKKFVLLFPVSAIFWWYFEFLNRFVQNWYYLGVESFSPFKYTLVASFSFSTVLPAVVSLYELLKESLNLKEAYGNFYRISLDKKGLLVIILFALASIGMFFLAVYPDCLFPLLWVSPLIIICSIQVFLGINTVFLKGISNGDWSDVVAFALSGLVCGFFWEMWNFYSYPKWVYSIPFVSHFKIFEMPLLGYAGYLPFGLECGIIALLILDYESVF